MMKKIFIWLSLALVLVAFGSLPTFFSTQAGKKILVEWVNKNISGEISLGEINLSWFSHQKITHFKLNDSEGKELLNVPFFETNTPLFYLLLGSRTFNETVIKDPFLFLEQKENNKTNLEKALTKKAKKEKLNKPKKEFPKFKNKLNISNGTLILSSGKIRPIKISDIQIDKQLDPNAFHISAKTEQGNIAGSLLISTSFSKVLQIQADVRNFPVAILDQFYETSLFSEGLGPTLNSHFYLSKGKLAIRVEGEVNSQNLNGLIKGDTYDNKFYLDPNTRLKLSLKPAFFSSAMAISQKELWKLAQETDLYIQIEKGIFPLHLRSKADIQDIVFQGSLQMERGEITHPSLGNYALNQFEVSMIMLNNLEIAYQGKIQGKESTELQGNFSITPDKKILFNYDYKNFPVSILDLFSPKAAKNLGQVLGKTFDVSGSGTYIEKCVNTDFSLISSLLDLKGNLEGKNPDFAFKLSGSSKILSEKAKFLGSCLGWQTEGKLNLENQELSLPSLSGKLFTSDLDLDFKGKIGEEGKPFSYKNINLTATGKFKLPKLSENFSTKEAIFSIYADGSKNLIVGKGEATFDRESSSFNFEVKDLIQNEELSLEEIEIDFSSNLAQLPVEILQSFAANTLPLSTLLGDKLTLKAEGTWAAKKEPKALVTVNAKGVGFQTSLSFAFDKTLAILPNKPSYLYWELTPERYKAILTATKLDPNYSPKYILAKTAPIELKISKLNCRTLSPKKAKEALCNSGFVGELDVGTLVFRNIITKEPFVVQKIAGAITGEELYKEIHFNLNGLLEEVATLQPSFSFQGGLLNPLTAEGKINREQMAVQGKLDLNLLPVRQLTEILPLKEEVRQIAQALLGDSLNAEIEGQISHQRGPITVDIKASNFKAHLPLALTPEAITLVDTVESELTLTHDVNESLIKDINPLLITGAFSDHPIKIYIEKEGFSIPIKPFSFHEVLIEKGVVDIGKIRVGNGGHIQSLMEFLKAKDISEDHEMDAWFTPIFFSLKEGAVKYKRFDALLAGNIHIALWGKINLIKDKVHMTLGIAPMTLKQRFNILGISKKDMFQVKMEGTTEKLELDWSSAYTRIGILIARTAGGHIGYIIGGIVEQIMALLGEEPTPESTTYPLPWASDGDQEEVPKEAMPQETLPPPQTGKKFFKKIIQFLIP